MPKMSLSAMLGWRIRQHCADIGGGSVSVGLTQFVSALRKAGLTVAPVTVRGWWRTSDHRAISIDYLPAIAAAMGSDVPQIVNFSDVKQPKRIGPGRPRKARSKREKQ